MKNKLKTITTVISLFLISPAIAGELPIKSEKVTGVKLYQYDYSKKAPDNQVLVFKTKDLTKINTIIDIFSSKRQAPDWKCMDTGYAEFEIPNENYRVNYNLKTECPYYNFGDKNMRFEKKKLEYLKTLLGSN